MGDGFSFWSRLFFKKGLQLYFFQNGDGRLWFGLSLERMIQWGRREGNLKRRGWGGRLISYINFWVEFVNIIFFSGYSDKGILASRKLSM